MFRSKKLTSYALLTLVIISLASIATEALAQIPSPVEIVEVSPQPTYPGESIVVTIEVDMAPIRTIIRLCNNENCDVVWAEQIFVPPDIGRYTLTLTLPEKLPGLANRNATYRMGVVVVSTRLGVSTRTFYIAPKIKVSPLSTTIVKPDGTPNRVTIEFLGYAPEDIVSTIVFEGPSTYRVTVTVSIDSEGYGNTSFDLLGIGGRGIPRGKYEVYGVGRITTDLSKAKNGTIEIRPQVIISPIEGHGRCDAVECELEDIAIVGYGFSLNTAIDKIELRNINFTNVVYTFDLTNVVTDGHGFFETSNLKRYIAGGKGTNMTAGLYIPVVYEERVREALEFRNVYYIVRPLLVALVREEIPVVRPGDSVTIAAYGYAPGAFWRHVPRGYDDNYLDAYWEKAVRLDTFRLGKDGNTTFTIRIPLDSPYGVHYIWGVDKWGYEYALAVIVGAGAYYTIVPEPPVEPIVSAGYNNERIKVCPCPEVVIGCSYCGKQVVYAGQCDYLGDKIEVVIVGASPGETFTIYFDDIPVKTVVANASIVRTSFVVPTVPEGNYTIVAVGSISGYIEVLNYYNGETYKRQPVTVIPKLLLLDLDKYYLPVLTGPGFVRVLGTGFRPGTSFVGMLVNNTDAAFILNNQVLEWTADEKGVLVNSYSRDVITGLYIPALEPGAYEIKLMYVVGAETKITLPGYVFVINNISRVATKSDIELLRKDILSRLGVVENAVRDARTSLEAAISALDRSISGKIETVGRAVDSLSRFISANMADKTDVKTLTDSMTKVLSAIDSVAKSISELRTVVATRDDIKALPDIITRLNTLLSNLSDATKILRDIQGTIGVLKTLGEDLKNIDKDLETALKALERAESEIRNLRTDVSGLKTDVDVIERDVSGLKTDVGGIKTDVSGLKTDVGGIKSNVDTARAGLADVDSNVATLRTLVIIAMVFAIVAAAAAIYSTISISRALAK